MSPIEWAAVAFFANLGELEVQLAKLATSSCLRGTSRGFYHVMRITYAVENHSHMTSCDMT